MSDRKGYILKAEHGLTGYFVACIRGELRLTEDRHHAWWTSDLDLASQTIKHLSTMKVGEFIIKEFAHVRPLPKG